MNEPQEREIVPHSGAEGSGPSWVLNKRFNSMLDLTAQVQGWDIDFRQIDSGPLSVEILQVGVGACLLSHARFNRRFLQRGVAPAGMRTFGLVESGVEDVTWGGRVVDETTLIVFHPLGEFEAVAAAGFDCYVLSFAERHLGVVANHFGLLDAFQGLDGADMVATHDPDDMASLRRRLGSFCADVGDFHDSNPGCELPADMAAELEYEIPGHILGALAGSELDLRLPPEELRYSVAKRAVAFAEENSDEVLTVENLREATGVSRRTLNYAFREHLGVTPKAYLKSMRLDAARRDLGRSDPDAKIADIANRHGFWHMGQFAADYRKQFGELPSNTLRRPADSDPAQP
jgi:AraC family ethanolamine operon transcriptional activator